MVGDQVVYWHDLGVVLISVLLVNNFVLVQFLGLCPFMGVSSKLESAWGMSLATTFVLTVGAVSSYLVDVFVLQVFQLSFLRTLVFILVVAVVVQFTEIVVKKVSPLFHRVLGVYLPLITTNCAVLGVVLLNSRLAEYTIMHVVVSSLGAALGFSLVLIFFSAIRERIAAADVPVIFRGTAIAMVTAGIMSLAFLGFTGLVRL